MATSTTHDTEQAGDRTANIRKRIDTAKRLGLHPMYKGFEEYRDLEEGTHYEVIAYTDWADVFVPTVVKWSNGEVDDLKDRKQSIANAEDVLRQGRNQ